MKSVVSFGIQCHVVAAVVAAATVFADTPVVEDQPPIDLGIAGAFKVGSWAQLTTTLGPGHAGRAHLEVDAPDPDGSVVTYQGDDAELIAAGPNRLTLLFKMGRLEGTIGVRVIGGDRPLVTRALRVSADSGADHPPLLRESAFLIAHVHSVAQSAQADPSHFAEWLSAGALSGSEGGSGTLSRSRVEVAEVVPAELLPSDFRAFGSLDAIVLTGRLDIDRERSRAIEQWVRSGGHLVVTVGKAAETFSTNPLASWLPVKVEGKIALRDLSAVESFCRQSSRIISSLDEPIEGARLSVADGRPSILSLEGPLLCRAAYGLGRVTVFGIDLDDPHLVRWTAAGDLLRRLIDLEDSSTKQARPATNRLTQSGITELATQLDATQDEFAAVSRMTTWHVMGLLVALLLVIGPIDFLIVHKLLKRPELTWGTFPLFTILAAGIAICGTWSKGDRVLSNQLDVVDIDAVTGTMRANSHNLLYSPENRRFNVSAEPAAIVPAAAPRSLDSGGLRLGWLGKAESSFGGMYWSGGAEIARTAYSCAPGARRLNELPISVWSTKALEAQWEGRQSGLVESQLESRGPGHFGGTFRHHLPEPIEDWIVAFGRQVFYIDPKSGKKASLPPEVPWSPQSGSQRELSGYLTGATQTTIKGDSSKYDEVRLIQTDYDPLSRNPTDIMRMLSFHREAGGTLYTGLVNGALRNFDLSPLLELNRAILVGYMRRPNAHWAIDGKPIEPAHNITFVRFVLPVRMSREASEE